MSVRPPGVRGVGGQRGSLRRESLRDGASPHRADRPSRAIQREGEGDALDHERIPEAACPGVRGR